MSSLNMMPSAPPEQLYPELPSDNFPLSQNLWNSKINFPPNSKLQKTRRNIQKSSNRHALCHRRFGLSLSLSVGLWIAFSLTVLGIIICAPLGTVGAFCGAGTAKNSAWKWQTWKIQSLALSNRNCINALASKSLIDGVVTDREFQIVNSELEKYFKLKETVQVKLREKPSPRPDIEKNKTIKFATKCETKFKKNILSAEWFQFTKPNHVFFLWWEAKIQLNIYMPH